MHETWQTYLSRSTANIVDGVVHDFGQTVIQTAPTRNNYLVELSALGLLQVSGSEAASFLHAQLSSDILALEPGQQQLSSWCNIKGRVIASLRVFREDEDYFLLLDAAMLEKIAQRLGMFILRSDVRISMLSEETIRIGLAGEEVHERAIQAASKGPGENAVQIKLAQSPPVSILVCPVDEGMQLWETLQPACEIHGLAGWRCLEINAGIAWIGEAGSEEFLPQSLNLDLLGGLSFSKGCYPGQEIIARMHFRGKLKQRLFRGRATCSERPASGMKLYTSATNRSIGELVNSCHEADGGCMLLFTMDLEYRDIVDLHLGERDGPAVELLPLPYPLDP